MRTAALVICILSLNVLATTPCSTKNATHETWQSLAKHGIDELSGLEEEKAFADFTAAIRLNPLHARLFMDRAECLMIMDRPKDAEADLRHAYNLALKEHDDSNVLQDICQRLPSRIQDKHECLTLLRNAYKLRPDPRLLANVAEREHECGEYSSASQHFSEALTNIKNAKNGFAPEDELNLRKQWSGCLMKAGKYEQAVQQLTQCIHSWSAAGKSFVTAKAYELYDQRADCYFKLHQPKLGEADKTVADKYRKDLFEVAPFRTK